MSNTLFLRHLSILSREELLYKKLYLKDPDTYREPVGSWEELIIRYKKHGNVIPDHAPTAIKDMFLEDDLFLEKGFSVAVVNHARYGPPFLHQHSFIKLIYVLQGSCTQITEKNRICMKAGDFCIIAPRVTNATFSCNDEDIVINILMRYDTFSTAFLSLLTEQDVISDFFWQMMYRKKSNQLLLFQNVNDPVLDGIVIDIYNELVYEGSPSNLMLKGYIILFFGNVLRKHIEKAAIVQNISTQYKILPKILEYMNEHVSYITLPALSEHFHLSTGHTSRMIHQETGLTFSQLLKDMRIKTAAEMLINSSLSIGEIINWVGYLEPSRFYKNFKKAYKMTPAVYRENKDMFFTVR